MTRHIFMFSIMALALQAPGPLRAETASRSSLEAKLALENSLEKRVRMVLSEALGTEDVIVIISAELAEQDKKSTDILPGIPQKERIGEPSLSTTLTMVKKISASLILDRSVTQEDTALARKLASGLLGLPADRQDLITVEKMDFRKTRPLTAAALLAPPNLWSLVWILVVGLLALVTVNVFLSPLSKSARAFVEAFSANAAASASAGERSERAEQEAAPAAAAAAAELPAAKEIEGRKPPFWFLGPGHLGSLAFIMKTRPVEDLTIVLSYAPAELAAKLAEALHPRSAEAMAALPKVTLMTEARIRALEAEVLSSLDYVVGGENKALNIIGGLDEAAQDKALASISKLDPSMSRKLSSSLVRLVNIQNLEPVHAQALARRLPMRVLAAALKGSAYARPFVQKLVGGMQERFQQELDLTRDLPAEAYKTERAKVVETMRQMLKEGLITLKAGGPAAALPGARPAPAPLGGRPGAAAQPSPAAKPAAAAAAGPKPAPAAAPMPAPAPKP
ncbi:MAG: hypothetical protein HY550_09595 [Elusimicrobia bacterium]|nr:hypothetical protein [Elusimicrobiota bacterium]